MGLLIEKYIGKTGRKLFLLFCWLFTLIVIAAFADMVAGTFNAYTVTEEGTTVLAELANVNGAAGSISLFFMGFAVVFGLLQKKFNLDGWKEVVLGLLFTFASLALGMNLPLVAGKSEMCIRDRYIMICKSMGANPVGPIMLCMIASMTAFFTPLATPTVPQVMGAGNYIIKQLVKMGWVIFIVITLVSVFWVMTIYPVF